MRATVTVLLVAGVAGCSTRSSPTLEIAIAPLDLPDVGRVCYDLRVTNGAAATGATVWSRGTPGLNGGVADPDAVCSDRYGNRGGGDITYIGTCDADGGPRTNSVTLWLDGLYDGGDGYVDPTGEDAWANPCPTPLGCTLEAPCRENEDTLVAFDLTIMRAAKQGFFDIAVNFADVFCSAKFESCDSDEATTLARDGLTYVAYAFEQQRFWALWDTSAQTPYWVVFHQDAAGDLGAFYDNDYNGPGPTPPATLLGRLSLVTGAPIRLLHGADGTRKHTAVAALACTAGPDTATRDIGTELLLTTPTVSCAGATFALPLAGLAPGQHTATANGKTLRYAIYNGREDLGCGGYPCNKVYYNLAFDLESLAAQGVGTCVLRYAGTAIEAGDVATIDGDGLLADPSAQYGAIGFAYDTTEGLPLVGPGGPECTSHILDRSGSLVRSTYLQGDDYGTTSFGGFDLYNDGGTTRPFPRPAPLTVVSTSPAANATGFVRDGHIEITFDRPLDPADFTGLTFALEWGRDAVAGVLNYAGKVVTFVPDSPLAADAVHTATLNGAIIGAGVAGGLLAWTFTTEAPPAQPPLRVFVLSEGSLGFFGGLAVADQYCQTEGAALGAVAGEWKAWLSVGTQSPSNRFSPKTIGTSRPFALVDGTIIANNWADLTDGTLRHAIDKNASGQPAVAQVWTNTRPDGTTYEGEPLACSGFTNLGGTPALIGHTDAVGSDWSNKSMLGCVNAAAFYCFEQAP